MKVTDGNIHVEVKRKKALTKVAENYSNKVVRIANKKDYSCPEVALSVANDEQYQNSFTPIIEALSGSKHVIVIGIGGSSLGIEAIYHAVAFQTGPRLHVFDAIESYSLDHLEEVLDSVESPRDIAICIISKSGTTTETITNAASIISVCEEKFGEAIKKRVVLIGSEGTDFLKEGKKQGVFTACIPNAIGGRYSVFTAVGMIPLGILGIDTTSFKEGVHEALSKKNRDIAVNHAVDLAILAEEGIHTVNFFTFNDRLRYLGFWYRQLLAESIGKEMTTDNTTFSHQLLPTVASSVDLHSMAQLYWSGYKGIYTHFVYGNVENEQHKLTDHWMMLHLTMLSDRTPLEVKSAIRKAVLETYKDEGLPFRTTEFSKITTFELGEFMALMMFEVMCLGALFKVDVFNQPNVELYKRYTRTLLS